MPHSTVLSEDHNQENRYLWSSPEEWSLLAPAQLQRAVLRSSAPILIVAIDTEAEFDWKGPFLRTQTTVRNIRQQTLAQKIFDDFSVRPVYLIDYAVATQTEGYRPLLEFLNSGRCEIGAHLHSWITPPFDEKLNDRTSFGHNLSTSLQKEKLTRLTEAISCNLGIRPVSYRAGRYGIGEETACILDSLRYSIDLSVQPGIDMRRIHGPDFRHALDTPYWFGNGGRLLELPATAALIGALARRALPEGFGIQLYDAISRPQLNKMRSLGIFARLNLLERLPLTPEGVSIDELRRLTLWRLARGKRVFVLSYHSSSLLPGSTEYVRSASELSLFLRRILEYLEFFMNELGGVCMTPTELRSILGRG